ncbi:hypothetical protein WICPIJ_000253 [Wickerhamomyces pijperi]|uniref:3-oxoacyl-[acyl-carrier-protein] reductase n=1 Tax=Wickerhamomyces pijperi TaxID=599730 RepID=A0A9P8TSW9_WICPI|nr:hypothetical protein WICPIJ_000253 [Wickerhamomyces pijperi]
MSLIGKKALITGGSKGIGLTIAKGLSKKGASIILLSRSANLLKHNVENELSIIDHTKQSHSYIQSDLSDISNLESTINTNMKLFKDVNILINSAGISQNSLLLKTSTKLTEEIINTNLTSPMILSRLLLKPLLVNKPSSIINISSVLAMKGTRGTSIYSATKAGLLGFTRSLAVELGGKQIRVNSVSPGLVKSTDMGKGLHFENCLNRDSVDQEEIVKTVLFLLENESITGQNIVVDNGYLC